MMTISHLAVMGIKFHSTKILFFSLSVLSNSLPPFPLTYKLACNFRQFTLAEILSCFLMQINSIHIQLNMYATDRLFTALYHYENAHVSVKNLSHHDRNIIALNLFICFVRLQVDLNLFCLQQMGKHWIHCVRRADLRSTWAK